MFRAQSPALAVAQDGHLQSDDTRGCMCTICVVDLLMMSGLRSKHVEEFNLM